MQRRRIWLCADDYGIAPGVNAAIRDLAKRGRINATSVMVVSPHFDAGEAKALDAVNGETGRLAIGLHLTLTAPFRPLVAPFRPLRRGAFLPLANTFAAGALRRFRSEALRDEVAAQLAAFRAAFGRPPDFIDGHQHTHLFPQIREAVLALAATAAPDAWVRQCGRAPHMRRSGDAKAVVLDRLSAGFCRRAEAMKIKTNPAFAGSYDFRGPSDYAALFPRFIDGMPEAGLVMCHPGFPDAELARLDPLTGQRRREYDFFASNEFPSALDAHGVTLA